MISRLQSASGYVNQVESLGNIPGQFTTWQQTIGNNLNTMGRTLGLQQSQQQNQTAILQALQQHAQSAQGQMQAIQAGNELAGANAAQLAQIQATLISTAQMQASNAAVAGRQAGNRGRRDVAFRATAVDPDNRLSAMVRRNAEPENINRCRNPRWPPRPFGRAQDISSPGRRYNTTSALTAPPILASRGSARRTVGRPPDFRPMEGSSGDRSSPPSPVGRHRHCCALAITAPANAQSADVLDQIVSQFQSRSAGWEATLRSFALSTFGILAAIEFAWAAFKLAFRGADVSEWLAELVNQISVPRLLPCPASELRNLGKRDRQRFPPGGAARRAEAVSHHPTCSPPG